MRSGSSAGSAFSAAAASVSTRSLLGDVGLRRRAGQRLDAAHAGGDRAFADDLEQADVAGAAHMGAAAQLGREHLVLVRRSPPIETTRTSSPYFSPNSASAPAFDRGVGRHQPGVDRGVVRGCGR